MDDAITPSPNVFNTIKPISVKSSDLNARDYEDTNVGLNPLIQRVKNSVHRRHQSVAPKYRAAAENNSMHYQLSAFKPVQNDQIYVDRNGSLKKDYSLQGHPQSTRAGKGYPNIFSSRRLLANSIAPDDKETQAYFENAFTSPSNGSLLRNENYLAKIQSEKRNMIKHHKFSNSGAAGSKKIFER